MEVWITANTMIVDVRLDGTRDNMKTAALSAPRVADWIGKGIPVAASRGRRTARKGEEALEESVLTWRSVYRPSQEQSLLSPPRKNDASSWGLTFMELCWDHFESELDGDRRKEPKGRRNAIYAGLDA